MNPYQQDPGFSNQFEFQPEQNGAMQYANLIAGKSPQMQVSGGMSEIAQLVALLKRKRMLDALSANAAGQSEPPTDSGTGYDLPGGGQ